VEPRYRRRDKPGKLAAFQTQLIQALEADAHRPKRERRTGLALKAQITAQGYTGGYTRVPRRLLKTPEDGFELTYVKSGAHRSGYG